MFSDAFYVKVEKRVLPYMLLTHFQNEGMQNNIYQ
jgi:hypothetical protein